MANLGFRCHGQLLSIQESCNVAARYSIWGVGSIAVRLKAASSPLFCAELHGIWGFSSAAQLLLTLALPMKDMCCPASCPYMQSLNCCRPVTDSASVTRCVPPGAGHVPLRIIAERILAHHATDQFGDFRGTLLGLLAAYAYESSILAAATRLVSSDAFHALFSLYQSHTRFSQLSRPGEDVGMGGPVGAAEASSDESSGAGPSSSHAAAGTGAPAGSRLHRQQAAGILVSGLAACLWDTAIYVDKELLRTHASHMVNLLQQASFRPLCKPLQRSSWRAIPRLMHDCFSNRNLLVVKQHGRGAGFQI